MSNFESCFLQRDRFHKKMPIEGKLLTKSSTYTFRMIFQRNTKSSFSLQGPLPRDNRFCYSNNAFVVLSTRVVDAVFKLLSFISFHGLYICRYCAPLKALRKLQLLSHRTCLTTLEKTFDETATFLTISRQFYAHARQKCFQTNTHKQILAGFQSLYQKKTPWQQSRFIHNLRHWSCWRFLLGFLFIQHNLTQ